MHSIIKLCFFLILFLTSFIKEAVAQQFNLQGSATQTGPLTYTITPDQLNLAGMITNYYPLNLTQNFTLNFQLNFGVNDATGADGFAFLLSNVCSPTLTTGGGLGVMGIPNSLIADFDTWDNGVSNNDISSDHCGIYADGQMNAAGNIMDAATVPVCLLPSCGNVEDGQWYDVAIQWEFINATSQRLSVFFNGVLRTTSTRNHISERFNNNSIVFWSISGSTGGSRNLQQFRLASGNNNNNPSYCAGENFTLTAPTLGTNYTWTGGAASVTNIASYTATTSGIFTCNYTDYCGISRSVNFTITVNPIPVASLNSPVVCGGNNATLTASTNIPGAYSYVWTVPTGATNPGNTGSFNTIIPGTYSFIATNTTTGCISNSASGNVSFVEKPIVTINNPAPICDGQQATINATPVTAGNFSYTWTVPTSASNPGNVASFNATINGNYSVQITNTVTGCISDIVTTQLTVNPLPVVSLNSPQVCDYLDAQLTASTAATGNYNYVWSFPAGVANPGNTASFSTTVPGNYTVQISNSLSGCVGNTATGTVAFIARPVVSINNPTECEGTAAIFTATPGVSGNYSFNWTVPPGVNNPGNVASFSTSIPGVYSVAVTNNVTGCSSINTTGNATILPIVKPQFIPVQPVCSGSLINPLPAVSLNNITGTWTPAINNLATTFYAFTPLGAVCTDTASMIIRVNNVPVISIGSDPEICPGQKIILNPNATGFALNYQWQDGSTDPFYLATTKGDYSVTVSNQCGSVTGNITIKQGICKVNIPTGFTPDNDGLNDHFGITGASYVSDFSMQVYNRWGQKVFETKNPSPGWDGNFSGTKQPAGVYVYRISFTYLLTGEKGDAKGTLMLIR